MKEESVATASFLMSEKTLRILDEIYNGESSFTEDKLKDLAASLERDTKGN